MNADSSKDYEARITAALADAGGPPELAAHLLTIARAEILPDRVLLTWIQFHYGDWDAASFQRFVTHYQETERQLTAFRSRPQRNEANP